MNAKEIERLQTNLVVTVASAVAASPAATA